MKIVAKSIHQARKFEAYLKEMGVQHAAQVRGTWVDGNKELVFATSRPLSVVRIPSDHWILIEADGCEVSVRPSDCGKSTVEFVCKEQQP